MKNVFEDIISLKEASKIYDIDDSVLRKKIINGDFVIGKDVKKFGKQWVVLKSSLDKIFKNKINGYSENKKRQIYYFQSELIIKYSTKYKKDISFVTNIFKKMNVFEYIYDCYDYLHLSPINECLTDINTLIKDKYVYERK